MLDVDHSRRKPTQTHPSASAMLRRTCIVLISLLSSLSALATPMQNLTLLGQHPDPEAVVQEVQRYWTNHLHLSALRLLLLFSSSTVLVRVFHLDDPAFWVSFCIIFSKVFSFFSFFFLFLSFQCEMLHFFPKKIIWKLKGSRSLRHCPCPHFLHFSHIFFNHLFFIPFDLLQLLVDNLNFVNSIYICIRFREQKSKCVGVKKTNTRSVPKRPVLMRHGKPHRRLLEVRPQLGSRPPTPRRLRHWIRPVRPRRQRRSDLRRHRLLRPRRRHPSPRHTPLRRHPVRPSLDRLCHQHAHQTLPGAHLQQLQNPRRPWRQRPHRRRRLHHSPVHQ